MNHATQLLEKDSSGCAVLLRDDKKEDLSRMFRLFSRLGNEGLEPIAKIFKKHIQACLILVSLLLFFVSFFFGGGKITNKSNSKCLFLYFYFLFLLSGFRNTLDKAG